MIQSIYSLFTFGVRLICYPLLLSLATAYNQNPRLYTEVNLIKFVDPLLHGFNVMLPNDVVLQYLDRDHLPMVYVTAVPLNQKGANVRRLLYMEDIVDNMVYMDGLEEKSWYYICIEFENMHRRERQGNTSTTCIMKRTLDEFGKSADSTVMESALSAISGNFLEFQLQIDTNFPEILEIFMENGPTAVQTYFVSQSKSIRVIFDDLIPGFNYGRLCVVERPTLSAYSTLGRTIQVHSQDCHLDNLQTDTDINLATAESYVRSNRNVRTNSGSNSIKWSNKLPFRLLATFSAIASILVVRCYSTLRL